MSSKVFSFPLYGIVWERFKPFLLYGLAQWLLLEQDIIIVYLICFIFGGSYGSRKSLNNLYIFRFNGTYIFKKYAFMIFWISFISVVNSHFSSLVLLIWVFSLSFGWFCWSYQSCFFFKEQLCNSLIPVIFNFIDFCLILIIFLALLLWSLTCS